MIKTYSFPESLAHSEAYKLTVAGQTIPVFATADAHYATLEWDPKQSKSGMLDIKVHTPGHLIKTANIRPLNKELACTPTGQELDFTLTKPEYLYIEIDNLPRLFLWVNAPETDKPDPNDPNVLYYEGGKHHYAGIIELQSNQTLYIEEGAVVTGCVEAYYQENVCVRGRGILDGSCYDRKLGTARTSILFAHCKDVTCRDLIMIDPSAWMLLPGDCDGVHIHDIKQIGIVMCSDGIDITGSRNVLIENCFLRNNDDCIVIKACNKDKNAPTAKSRDFRTNVENLEVRNTTLVNAAQGNAIEIGYELAADHVRNVQFHDIDVICVEGHGAVFSIHNGDRACVENITYENIRIEHCYDRFIDFRVLVSRYNEDEERGSIRNLLLKNIHWHVDRFNPGSTISLIGGYDANHTADSIHFENITLGDRKIQDVDELELHTRHASDIRLLNGK